MISNLLNMNKRERRKLNLMIFRLTQVMEQKCTWLLLITSAFTAKFIIDFPESDDIGSKPQDVPNYWLKWTDKSFPARGFLDMYRKAHLGIQLFS